MGKEDRPAERETRIARVLRPLGTKPMTRTQAVMAGKLLGLHWTSVYRLRRRFLRCRHAALPAPGRNTVARRLAEHRNAQAALLADEPGAQIPPGNFVATSPLEIVQIDHTQSDIEVVDDWFRRAIGRPWLSVAIDVATRCVVEHWHRRVAAQPRCTCQGGVAGLDRR